MKIKKTKQMKLDGLIKYIWESGIKSKKFYPEMPGGARFGNIVKVNDTGGISFDNQGYYCSQPFQMYTVEVEEEVTEETVFKELVILPKDKPNGVTAAWNCSVEDLKEDKSKGKIYTPQKNELTLIWSAEQGIPADGVLEVDSNA